MAYYVICDDDSKHESMTKEQILAAIAQAIETGNIGNIDAGFITKVKETNAGGYVTFWVGTQAEYNAVENRETNCLYIITDDTANEDLKRTITELNEKIDGAASVEYCDLVRQQANAYTDDVARVIAQTIPVMRVESWTVDIDAGGSNTHLCEGHVYAVFVTIITKQGHRVNGVWTAIDSGTIDQFLSGETDGQKSYYTSVDIAGEKVTVNAIHTANTYYVTALIKTAALQ